MIKYNPGPGVLPYMENKTASVVLLTGPIASGKTTAAMFKKIHIQSKWIRPDQNGKRRSRFMVVEDRFQDCILRAYLDWFPFGTYDKAHQTIKYDFSDGREVEIIFREWKDMYPGCSLEVTGAHLEQAHMLEQGQCSMIMGRVGRFPVMRDYNDGESPFTRPPQIDLTGWPRRYKHGTNEQTWIWEAFIADPRPGFVHYALSTETNRHNLPEDYYARLQECDFDVSGEWV